MRGKEWVYPDREKQPPQAERAHRGRRSAAAAGALGFTGWGVSCANEQEGHLALWGRGWRLAPPWSSP